MSNYFFLALDLEVVSHLLPLGDALIGGVVTLLGAFFAYLVGRKRQKQEVENLQAEKKSIEAASGVSTAEAAQIISQAAAATVQPLIERVKEQRTEIAELNAERTDLKNQVDALRDHAAKLSAQNKLMREKFKLQGEKAPELLDKGKDNDSLL